MVLSTLWAGLFAATLCAQGLDPAGGAQLQLSIYSGRPDPRCELTPGDLKEIRELIEKLPVDEEPEYAEAAPSRLGYCGYLLGPIPAGKEGQYHLLRVYRTGVELQTFFREESRSEVVTLLDKPRALESLLTRIIAREVEISPNSRQEIASGVDRRRKIPKPQDQR